MSLQTVAYFLNHRTDDMRGVMPALFAARDEEWKRRRGEHCTDEIVNEFVRERIRCRALYY